MEFRYGNGNLTVLFDPRRGDPLFVYTADTAGNVHATYGGRRFYTSRSGRSGAGYIPFTPVVRVMNAYRVDVARRDLAITPWDFGVTDEDGTPGPARYQSTDLWDLSVPYSYRGGYVADRWPLVGWRHGEPMLADAEDLEEAVETGQEPMFHYHQIIFPGVYRHGIMENVAVEVHATRRVIPSNDERVEASELRGRIRAVLERMAIRQLRLTKQMQRASAFLSALGIMRDPDYQDRYVHVRGEIGREIYMEKDLHDVDTLRKIAPHVFFLNENAFLEGPRGDSFTLWVSLAEPIPAAWWCMVHDRWRESSALVWQGESQCGAEPDKCSLVRLEFDSASMTVGTATAYMLMRQQSYGQHEQVQQAIDDLLEREYDSATYSEPAGFYARPVTDGPKYPHPGPRKQLIRRWSAEGVAAADADERARQEEYARRRAERLRAQETEDKETRLRAEEERARANGEEELADWEKELL